MPAPPGVLLRPRGLLPAAPRCLQTCPPAADRLRPRLLAAPPELEALLQFDSVSSQNNRAPLLPAARGSTAAYLGPETLQRNAGLPPPAGPELASCGHLRGTPGARRLALLQEALAFQAIRTSACTHPGDAKPRNRVTATRASGWELGFENSKHA